MELKQRVDEPREMFLLRVAKEFIKKNAPEGKIEYDNAKCDGYCLVEEIGEIYEEKYKECTIWDYLDGHTRCGIKVGDIVKVTRKAETDESGWNNVWVDEMDAIVGEELVVVADTSERGFDLRPITGELRDRMGCPTPHDFSFPYFVLEKIK